MNALAVFRHLALAGMLALLFAPGALWAQSYDLEVLIFQNLDGGGEELFPEDPGRPNTASAGSFPAASTSLSAVAQRLRNSAGYRVLYHQAWRQPGYSPSKAVPVAVYNDEASSAGTLEGTVTLNRRRFLHADVDLWFEDADSLLPVRMRESRKMRSEELHYIDHPRLGVLIIANPAP